MKERKGYKTYYNRYKIEFNILIAVLILVIIAFIIYFVWFYNNESKIETGLICTKQQVESLIKYEIETCEHKDDFEVYESKYIYVDSDSEDAISFNKAQEEHKKQLLKTAEYTNIHELKLLNAVAQDIEVVNSDGLITFITMDANQSYYDNNIYGRLKVTNFNENYSNVSSNEIIEKIGITSLAQYNSKFKNELIVTIQNTFNYFYHEQIGTIRSIDNSIEQANLSKIKGFYIEQGKLTFIFDIISSAAEQPRYFKFVLADEKFTSSFYRNKVY